MRAGLSSSQQSGFTFLSVSAAPWGSQVLLSPETLASQACTQSL